MTSASLPAPRIGSYLFFSALFLVVIFCRLGPALLAGLFCYTIADATSRKLSQYISARNAKWIALLILPLAVTLMGGIFWFFIRQTLATVPGMLDELLPKLTDLSEKYGISLPFENIDELREVVLLHVRKNAGAITHASGLLTKQLFHILIGIFIAILCFTSEHSDNYGPNLYDSLRREFAARISSFMGGFERVLGAQVLISAINAALTALFLIAVDFPHIAFLTSAAFILGLLPIVGNILSNTIIVSAGLTISLHHGLSALAFLVIIHKAEYFFNSHIIGSSMRMPMWQTLLGIMIGEVIMGVPGIILAPAMIAFIREEMAAIPD